VFLLDDIIRYSLLCLAVGLGACQTQIPSPSFTVELYLSGSSDIHRYHNSVVFLSDDLVLVVVNSQTMSRSETSRNLDSPNSKVLLVDIKEKKVVRSADLPIEKAEHSVIAISGQRFVLRNESGVFVCSVNMTCQKIEAASRVGYLLSSPMGKTFLSGGFTGADRILFDSDSMSPIDRFPPHDPLVVPGDEFFLIRYLKTPKLYLKHAGSPPQETSIGDYGGIGIPYTRFLSPDLVAASESVNSLATARTDGRLIYRIPVRPWYEGSSIVTSAEGVRFGIYESFYSRLNSFVHFYDIDEGRAKDVERIRVFETKTGKLLFELTRDPRPYSNNLAEPALSRNGKHLAVIYRTKLEIYDIP